MRQIPAPLIIQIKNLLIKNKISQRDQSYYLKWLRYYFDFCQKYDFKESDTQSLPNFIKKLKEKKRTASNNGCSGVDLSKMGGDFIGDISFLEMFEESADAVL